MWHVISHSGVMISITNCYILIFTCIFSLNYDQFVKQFSSGPVYLFVKPYALTDSGKSKSMGWVGALKTGMQPIL